MSCEQPLEEIDGLADFVRRVAHGARRERSRVICRARSMHRLEVAHDEPDVAQDLRTTLDGEVLALGVGEPPVDLEVHDGFAVRCIAR